MTTVLHSGLPMQPRHAAAAHPLGSVLRSTGVLLAATSLTVAVLVALARVVDTWA